MKLKHVVFAWCIATDTDTLGHYAFCAANLVVFTCNMVVIGEIVGQYNTQCGALFCFCSSTETRYGTMLLEFSNFSFIIEDYLFSRVRIDQYGM